LNDPNWEFDDYDTASTTYGGHDSFQMDDKEGIPRYSGPIRSPSDDDSHYYASSTGHLKNEGAIDYEDDSPYAEVRCAVANTDDPSMPINTFRMWFLGLLYTIVISGLNQFFVMRYPSVGVAGIVAQLTALPLGKFLEWAIPPTRFNTFGYVWSFNPGPFNIKEHTCVYIMANVVASGAYATDVIATQEVYYGQHWGLGYQLLLTISTQIIGFSFAGLVRQFLVWPASMIWPGALVSAAVFNTLHKNYGKSESGHMSRQRFFVIACLCASAYYWLPGYLFTALSVFNWVCWIAPENVVVNTLFGYSTGMGMSVLTFDWAMIGYIGNPLVTPWWAELNTMASFIIFFWLLTPILWAKNVFYSQFLPIYSYLSFDRFGQEYDPSLILTNGEFDLEKYQAYSPMYISITFAVSYGVQFAAFTALIVHTILWYRHDIIRQFRRSIKDEQDVHSRLMAIYPEVPHWWYGTLGIAAFVMGVIAIELFPTQMPVWCLILALIVAAVFVVPAGMVQAITNQAVSLNILAEVVVGYVLPGRPVAMMIFKTYGYIAMGQAIAFTRDLKLGHYMKIPPRTMFLVQVVPSIISCFVVVLVQQWMLGNIPDICQPNQKDRFICPSLSVFATASLLWGSIGPSRSFSDGQLYHPLLWGFLVGAIAPIPFYFLSRRYPQSLFKYVHMPVFFAGVGVMPPSAPINIVAWGAVGAIFQWFIRKRYFRWWMRYNYILSAALDSGVAIGVIVIFFTVLYPKGGFTLNWWGNTVWLNTFDSFGIPLRQLAPNATFGPLVWS
jgi:OPT family small oligopeptide transporter